LSWKDLVENCIELKGLATAEIVSISRALWEMLA
jgi:hypothetical protein